MGRYSFDNITAFSQTVNLPYVVPVANNNSSTPKIWALCVGIENYSNYPGYSNYIGNLSYSIDDAQAYYFLSSLQGGNVPRKQLALLTDENATNSKILLTANELFSKADENDLIVVFLSGHGARGYYCTSNDALRYEEINKVLENSRAKRELLIADACHSGTWAKEKDVFTSRGVKLTDEDALKLFYSELAKSSKNVTYLLAARPEELSWGVKGNGIFTYYLIKGLGFEAKTSNSPTISITDIYNYLSKTVPVATKDSYSDGRPSPQHPVLEGKFDENMPVSICNN